MNDDSISRKSAAAHLKKRLYETQLNNDTDHPYYEEIADNRIDVWMNEVPSVQPEQKRGKWLFTDAVPHRVYCSACYKTYVPNKEWIAWTEDMIPKNFCPNCGARMEE